MATSKNKAYIVLIAFAIALMGCCTAQQTSQILKPVVITSPDEIKKSFVEDIANKTISLVTVDDEGKLTPYCSGLWIDDNQILTAAHCIKKNKIVFYVTKENFDNKRMMDTAVLVKISVKDDLALLLTFEDKSRQALKLSEVKPWAGMKLFIVGHTMGMWWTYIEGVVAASWNVVTSEDLSASIQVSAPIWLGNSGGGAFDGDGRLVGLCSQVLASAPNIAFLVPASRIKLFLSER